MYWVSCIGQDQKVWLENITGLVLITHIKTKKKASNKMKGRVMVAQDQYYEM